MLKSSLLVLPSIMEGGANIISEALAVNLPVIASRIDGTVGLLGENSPGYYKTGDAMDLSRLLVKAEQEAVFYNKLCRFCEQRRPLFHPAKELLNWKLLLDEVKN